MLPLFEPNARAWVSEMLLRASFWTRNSARPEGARPEGGSLLTSQGMRGRGSWIYCFEQFSPCPAFPGSVPEKWHSS